MTTSATPSLADRCRCLLEAVMGVFGLEQRRGLLAGPLTLLLWIRTRQLRKEAQAFAEQFRVLMEQLLALLAAHQAGTLPAENAPRLDYPLSEPPAAARRAAPMAPVRRRKDASATARLPAPAPVNTADQAALGEAPRAGRLLVCEMIAGRRLRRRRRAARRVDESGRAHAAARPAATGGVGPARKIFFKRDLRAARKCADIVTISK